jgi:hypothetical protein
VQHGFLAGRIQPEHNPAAEWGIAGRIAAAGRRAIKVAGGVPNQTGDGKLSTSNRVEAVEHSFLAGCVQLEHHSAAMALIAVKIPAR